MIIPVILSGGSGTRLWPLSRALYPKQLLPLVNEATMLQDTVYRLAGLEPYDALYCVCNEEHRFLVAEQLHEAGMSAGKIILEPEGRNTAPAATIAALLIAERHPDALMLLLPADHVLADPQAFAAAVAEGAQAAQANELVTFGITPTAPETGYGYIRTATSTDSHSARQVMEFVEKPSREVAEQYVASGNYFWNSGIFLFKPSAWLAELEKYAPDILTACRTALAQAVEDFDFLRLNAPAFAASPSNSIDYAVMEKTNHASLVPLNAGWNDVGSWSALWEVQARDEAGNVSKGDVLLHDVRNSYLHATSRLVAAVGLDELIVVETADAVLVASRDSVQDVKRLVDELKVLERDETQLHRCVYRPWGTYETVDFADRFKVKRITVKPGAALSLQKHHHRAEHWIVVKGTAHVTLEDKVVVLQENQSTYIPVGAFHRLENHGNEPLELIEVQSGSYLGEDDIVRVDDRYGRR
uniref:mannose-1-phosphate guanylyltransferase n=1 Tax=Chlorobium chlorochromatii (strain CaD3) TaxID=340177 RepID=Q3AT84_CHLCH